MPIKGNIILADRNVKIFSGANIPVRVEIENMIPINFKEIYIKLEGKVEVKWEDLISKNKDGIIVYFMQQFTGREICINRQTTIARSGILPAGSHAYNVLVNIPHKLPNSFKGKSGWINYELGLMIHDINTEQNLFTLPMKIERYSELTSSELMLPLTAMHNKYFCWRFCNSKPIITKLTLPSASYKPGDIVKYSIQVENFTKYFDIHRITILISQTQQYIAMKPKGRIKQEHCNLYKRTHSLRELRRDKIDIDGRIQLSETLTPTSLESCLIMISYKFHVLIIVNGLHTDGYISVPLMIGHQNLPASIDNNVSNEIRLQMEDEPPPKYETLDLSLNNISGTKVFAETMV